ncbi:MAG: DegV family protein [Coriobacteriia bacterium]|nr:DegV family protein [Coriobacteriia bacterium]
MTGNNGYDIISDSTANLTDGQIEDFQIKILPLEFIVDGVSYKAYDPDVKTDNHQFYEMMRAGQVVRTSLVSISNADAALRSSFEAGRDVLYIGFDSALSSSYETVSNHMEKVWKDSYPDRRLRHIDSLSAALGHGLLVAETVQRRDAGMGLDELADWVEDNRLHIAHWFTVEDLSYLQRGGRLSKGAAIAGTLLNIKPVLHVDDLGRLVPVQKVRGRKRSLQTLFERLEQTIRQPTEGQSVFISHADCLDDAHYLLNMIKERFSGLDFVVNDLDPVIGAHSGPGTVAVFFNTDQGR